jgi:hypothetical protein
MGKYDFDTGHGIFYIIRNDSGGFFGEVKNHSIDIFTIDGYGTRWFPDGIRYIG